MSGTSRALKVAGLMIASFMPLSVHPQAWPAKPVRIIIPWAPGGSTDIVGRLLAADMTQRLKQTVIIDNRPGAGSILGLHLAAATPPDGYNFMMTSTAYGHLINKTQAKGIDYAKSFEPVVLIGFGDSVLTVHPALPVNSVKELIALAKKRPGELNYSSSGIGGFPHMNTEQVMTSLDSPDLLPKLEVQGVEIQKTSPADLGRLMAEETKKWADVIRRADIKGE